MEKLEKDKAEHSETGKKSEKRDMLLAETDEQKKVRWAEV